MTPALILAVIIIYFLVLMVIAHFTSKNDSNDTFFKGNNQSPWYLVAFGMIGASLSGVTFISVPGWVESTGLGYFQMVLGYLVGYAIIAFILIPVYYKMNVISIYQYLDRRFGNEAHKTGAGFFLLSRVLGASFRLYLVANVLQFFVFDAFGFPFWATVMLTLICIWIYTYKGGIRTIVFTDTLQTAFMLFAVVFAFVFIGTQLSGFLSAFYAIDLSEIWDFRSLKTNNNHFVKRFFGGALIALVMTGLDQDMMQKNLSCKNIKDAQKNMISMSIMLVPINLVFLMLGVFLFTYCFQNGISLPEKTDHLFPMVAFSYMPVYAGIIFLLGLIAATYSSADSALTSLTTSFCIDFLDFNKGDNSKKKTRLLVHIGFSILLALVIYLFKYLNNDSIISQIFKVASLTYGPLLGLFTFGLLTGLKPKPVLILPVCLISVGISTWLMLYSKTIFGIDFGTLLLLVNGTITFVGLLISSLLNSENN